MAHRPWSLTWSWRPLTSSRILGSLDRTAYGNTYSSGSTSSRQNSSTQSSFFWNSGSVEKSHAMSVSLLDERVAGQAGDPLADLVALDLAVAPGDRQAAVHQHHHVAHQAVALHEGGLRADELG